MKISRIFQVSGYPVSTRFWPYYYCTTGSITTEDIRKKYVLLSCVASVKFKLSRYSGKIYFVAFSWRITWKVNRYDAIVEMCDFTWTCIAMRRAIQLAVILLLNLFVNVWSRLLKSHCISPFFVILRANSFKGWRWQGLLALHFPFNCYDLLCKCRFLCLLCWLCKGIISPVFRRSSWSVWKWYTCL